MLDRSMIGNSWIFIPWMLMGIAIVGLNLASAVFLMKEKHGGIWLMLAGGILALLGSLGSLGILISMFMNLGIPIHRIGEWTTPVAALSGLGSLMFAIGLLLHVLRERGKGQRIAELEAILAARRD